MRKKYGPCAALKHYAPLAKRGTRVNALGYLIFGSEQRVIITDRVSKKSHIGGGRLQWETRFLLRIHNQENCFVNTYSLQHLKNAIWSTPLRGIQDLRSFVP